MPPIFLISGPSGVGKDSVIEGLQPLIDFNRVITTVTRGMRPGESQGNPYYFISVDEFKKLITDDILVEWAIVFNDYRGCTKTEIDRLQALQKPIVWKVDWHGVATIKNKIPTAKAIFIEPPSVEALERRLISRGTDSLEVIAERTTHTEEWTHPKDMYDLVVTNPDDKLAETVQSVLAYMQNQLSSWPFWLNRLY